MNIPFCIMEHRHLLDLSRVLVRLYSVEFLWKVLSLHHYLYEHGHIKIGEASFHWRKIICKYVTWTELACKAIQDGASLPHCGSLHDMWENVGDLWGTFCRESLKRLGLVAVGCPDWVLLSLLCFLVVTNIGGLIKKMSKGLLYRGVFCSIDSNHVLPRFLFSLNTLESFCVTH